MKQQQAIEIFNDSMRRFHGMDRDGNESIQLTGFGGLVLACGISFAAKHNPETLKIAALLLRTWADALEEKP